jgi:hypothetical protein
MLGYRLKMISYHPTHGPICIRNSQQSNQHAVKAGCNQREETAPHKKMSMALTKWITDFPEGFQFIPVRQAFSNSACAATELPAPSVSTVRW